MGTETLAFARIIYTNGSRRLPIFLLSRCIAADCAAYAYGDFHRVFISGRVTMIGCPKLDDIAAYQKKITAILEKHSIKSITVVRMEVSCCGGIVSAVQKAMLTSGTIVPYSEVVIGLDGTVTG